MGRVGKEAERRTHQFEAIHSQFYHVVHFVFAVVRTLRSPHDPHPLSDTEPSSPLLRGKRGFFGLCIKDVGKVYFRVTLYFTRATTIFINLFPIPLFQRNPKISFIMFLFKKPIKLSINFISKHIAFAFDFNMNTLRRTRRYP